jgi:hypothetical protein
MTKIAYIVGVTGAGKGHVADSLNSVSHVITVDGIQHFAGTRLAPFSIAGAVWNWEFWRSLLKHNDVPSAIQLAIENRHPGSLNDGIPIVAEAAILAMDDWRKAFAEALHRIDVTVDNEAIFWLDPPVEQLLLNIQTRDRPNQRDFDQKKAEDSRQWYRSQAKHLLHCRYESAETVTAAVQRFFDGDTTKTGS